MSSVDAAKKFANRWADSSTMRRALSPFFFVAMPTGQLLLWQALIPRHPIAWSVECEMGMPSAPRASAFTKSDSVRRPPVMIRVIPSAPTASRCRRVRGRAASVGSEMLFLQMSGGAPVPPPRPSRMM